MERLAAILATWSKEELEGFQKILAAEESTPEGLCSALRWSASSALEWQFSKPLTYYQIVQRVARKWDLRADDGDPVEILEQNIAQKLLKEAWEKLTPEQRSKLEEELRKIAENAGHRIPKEAGVFALLMAARLSGFGVYLMASTVLGFLGGLVNVTLPFAVYTAISRAIAVVIGPVGWIATAIMLAHNLTGPNWKKLEDAIVYISMMRNKPTATTRTPASEAATPNSETEKDTWPGEAKC